MGSGKPYARYGRTDSNSSYNLSFPEVAYSQTQKAEERLSGNVGRGNGECSFVWDNGNVLKISGRDG